MHTCLRVGDIGLATRKPTARPDCRADAIARERASETEALVRLRKDASTADASALYRLGDDRDVGSLRELVYKVATGSKRQRLRKTYDGELSLGDARSKEHDRE
jgi:hypothetical protein